MIEIPHLDKRVWIGLIAAGVALGLYMRHRANTGASTDPSVNDSIGTVDPNADPYSSGSYTAIPGTGYGMPGPAGPPGAKGQRGKRGPRGRPPKHKKHRHHNPTKHVAMPSGAGPSIMQQSHMANNTPVQSGVRVVQHRPGGVIQKGTRGD